MGMTPPAVGTIGWIDISVPDAALLRDFYCGVVGWTSSEIPMQGGTYADYCVHPPTPDAGAVAGICHARGPNADLPSQWLIYVTVADLDASLEKCQALGGSLVGAVRDLGSMGRMAVIRDPAGAVLALYQSAAASPA